MRRILLALGLLVACGGSGAAPHDASSKADAPPVDATRSDTAAMADAFALPAYSATPTQTLVPPANAGNAYGLVAAISADGKTLVTFDTGALYVFTRATSSAAFPTTPAQTIRPSGVSDIGVALSLSEDGALLACGAIATNNALEVLVFARQGATYATTPQVLPATSGYSEVEVAALSPDGSELAVDTSAHELAFLPRSGATFGSTPAQTIARPTGASDFFPMAAGLSENGVTFAIGDSGATGGGAVFVYTGGTTPAQTLMPSSGESDVGTSVALRPDTLELVEGSIGGPGEVGVFQRDSSGYTRVQTIAPPSGAVGDFGVSVSLALDGTLVVTDYGAHIYLFAPG